MAEQALIKNKFFVRVMPLPSDIREGCGFCLRFLPEDFEKAALFLSDGGYTITEAFMREETQSSVSYKRLSLGNVEKDDGKP